jgi:hypothetical protein
MAQTNKAREAEISKFSIEVEDLGLKYSTTQALPDQIAEFHGDMKMHHEQIRSLRKEKKTIERSFTRKLKTIEI